ncbi:MAG: hypothetical protein ACREK6_08725 [Candidatus Rokuibacteriota bacterium]
MAKIPELGLTPYVYKGVPASEGRIKTNIYIEAMHDLGHCKALVVVAADPDAERAANFGIGELPRVVASGRPGFLYVTGGERLEAAPSRPGVKERDVADVREFSAVLEQDLSDLLTTQES